MIATHCVTAGNPVLRGADVAASGVLRNDEDLDNVDDRGPLAAELLATAELAVVVVVDVLAIVVDDVLVVLVVVVVVVVVVGVVVVVVVVVGVVVVVVVVVGVVVVVVADDAVVAAPGVGFFLVDGTGPFVVVGVFVVSSLLV